MLGVFDPLGHPSEELRQVVLGVPALTVPHLQQKISLSTLFYISEAHSRQLAVLGNSLFHCIKRDALDDLPCAYV